MPTPTWNDHRSPTDQRPDLAQDTPQDLVVVVCGPPGVGKTTLAEQLAATCGLPHLSSDVARKQLAGLAPTDSEPSDGTSEAAKLRVYRHLATTCFLAGSAVVDATFQRHAYRMAFFDTYGRTRIHAPIFVRCEAPPDLIRRRALHRELTGASPSEATAQLVSGPLSFFEPLYELPGSRCLTVRTDRPVTDIVRDITAVLAARHLIA